MKIKTKDFKQALEIVKPGLASKEFMEQATNFAFMDGSVFTYNDALCVSHTLEGSDLKCAVKADLLQKYINKVSAKELEITQKPKELYIKAGRSRTGFQIANKIKLPLNNVTLDDAWEDLPSDFIDAVAFVSESCATNTDSAKLNSIHLHKDGYMEGTDRHRLSHWQLEHPIESLDTMLIPVKNLKAAMKINPTKIMGSSEWLHFSSEDGTILSCRLLDEDFMDTSQLLAKPKEKGNKIIFPEEIVPALERSQVFAQRPDKESEILVVSVLGSKIKIRSEAEGGAWHEEFVSVKYKGKKVKFAITVELLLNIIKKKSTCKIYKDKLIFTGGRWVHLASLSALPKDAK
jgi:DNA polymerase III sliding clamp (beta) subunit (PCNA family)